MVKRKENTMNKYYYNHIEIFEQDRVWQADYVRANGTRFALHRACCDTKAKALAEAKANVDVLNLLNGYTVA